MRRRLSRGLTSLKGAAGDEAKACLASETKGVPAGAMLEFAISVYMMVQASPEDRALYIFSILDTNGDKQVRATNGNGSPALSRDCLLVVWAARSRRSRQGRCCSAALLLGIAVVSPCGL